MAERSSKEKRTFLNLGEQGGGIEFGNGLGGWFVCHGVDEGEG